MLGLVIGSESNLQLDTIGISEENTVRKVMNQVIEDDNGLATE